MKKSLWLISYEQKVCAEIKFVVKIDNISDNELKFDRLNADSVVKSLVHLFSLCLHMVIIYAVILILSEKNWLKTIHPETVVGLRQNLSFQNNNKSL